MPGSRDASGQASSLWRGGVAGADRCPLMWVEERTMINEEQLTELKACDGGTPVLSVYVNIPPGLQPERAYITTFRALAQELRDRLQEPRRGLFEAEAGAVESWIAGGMPGCPAAVPFSCQATRLWQATFLPFPVTDHVAFEEQPHL